MNQIQHLIRTSMQGNVHLPSYISLCFSSDYSRWESWTGNRSINLLLIS